MQCDSAGAQPFPQQVAGVVMMTTGMRPLPQSQLENAWIKLTLCFLCFLQLQRPKDISTDSERDSIWNELIPSRARTLAWTKTWTKRGDQKGDWEAHRPSPSLHCPWRCPGCQASRLASAEFSQSFKVWFGWKEQPIRLIDPKSVPSSISVRDK